MTCPEPIQMLSQAGPRFIGVFETDVGPVRIDENTPVPVLLDVIEYLRLDIERMRA